MERSVRSFQEIHRQQLIDRLIEANVFKIDDHQLFEMPTDRLQQALDSVS